MRALILIGWLVVVSTAAFAQQGGRDADGRPIRNNLSDAERRSNTRLVVWMYAGTVERHVFLTRHMLNGSVKEYLWSAELPITLPYRPDDPPRYALVKTVEDKTILFLTWDPRSFVVDEQTGKVLSTEQGDAVLSRFAEWAPVRLQLVQPSTGSASTR